MLSRRICAFEANICRLLVSRCCLWTFTLADTIPPREASKRWTKLLKALRKHDPDWSGVRVFEMHPGKWGEYSHGLHVHLVSHKFFSDYTMKAMCAAHGWGHFDRRPIVDAVGALYVGKYLEKPRDGALFGMRLASSFGPQIWTRMKDIVIESLRTRCFKQAARMDWGDGRTWDERSWMEKIALVARLEWRVMTEDLEWDAESASYVRPAPPDRFYRLRSRTYSQPEFAL